MWASIVCTGPDDAVTRSRYRGPDGPLPPLCATRTTHDTCRGGAEAMNVVALAGRLARPAEERLLPSGDRLVAYEVTVPRPGERAETVPVVWFDAPASAV